MYLIFIYIYYSKNKTLNIYIYTHPLHSHIVVTLQHTLIRASLNNFLMAIQLAVQSHRPVNQIPSTPTRSPSFGGSLSPHLAEWADKSWAKGKSKSVPAQRQNLQKLRRRRQKNYTAPSMIEPPPRWII